MICLGLVLIFSTWADRGLSLLPGARPVISGLVATGTLVVFLHPYILFLMSGIVEFPRPESWWHWRSAGRWAFWSTARG
ncbi:hypothetical protein [Nesterenkonia pannonica]|uniref:hypothetical protein n=1 Tax=Nesterenkonia pannonica TaxID=1548602 RepID=UPI002164E72B|nr:hypothetical protein [Nesterenkonia pannonica]